MPKYTLALLKAGLKRKKTIRRLFVFIIFFFFAVMAYLFICDIRRSTIVYKISALERGTASYAILNNIKLMGRRILDLPYLVAYNFKTIDKDIPVYNLIISRKNLEKLNYNLPKGTAILSKEYKKTQPAKLGVSGKEYMAEVRYRGDWANHWAFEKKSWQINFLNDYFENQKNIGLILSKDRLFLIEQFDNYRAKKLGLTVPDSKLVILKVNGINYGVYFQVENWGKDFLEKSKMSGDANFYGESEDGALFDSIFYWKQYTSDPHLQYKNYAEMEKLLDLIKNSSDSEFSKKIASLLDMDNFYRWNIHSMLSGSTHQDGTHNMRLYFDSSIGKFKIFPWDVSIDKINNMKTYEKNNVGIDFVNYNPLVAKILKNPEFLKKRNDILWGYVKDKNNLEDDLKFYDKLYKKYALAFYQDNHKRITNIDFNKSVAKSREAIEYNFKYVKDLFKTEEFKDRIYINQNNIPIKVDILLKAYAPAVLGDIKLKINSGSKVDFSVFYDSNNDNKFDFKDTLLGDLKYNTEYKKYNFKAKDKKQEFNTKRIWLTNDNPQFVVLKEIQSDKLEETKHSLFLVPKTKQSLQIKDISIKISLKNYYTKNEFKSLETLYVKTP